MTELIQRTPKSRLVLGTCLLLASTSACTDSGGLSRTAGLTVNPSTTLDIDFGLRRDLELAMGNAFLGDVIHADLNNDGIADLVETTALAQKLNIALGRPDGTFDTIVERNTMGKGFRLALGDVNGDGRTDIAVANRERQGVGAQSIEVFLQASGLDFSGASVSFLGQSDPTDLAIEFNPRRGIAEVFATFHEERLVRVLDMQSGISLQEAGTLESSALGNPGRPFSLAFVDRFDTGLRDLVVGETGILNGADRVVIYPRSGFGGGGDARSTSVDFGDAEMVMSPVFKPIVDNVGDADGNGFDDLAVAQLSDDEVFLIPGSDNGFTNPIGIDFGGRTTSVIFPDLNGDGLAEAVATTLNQSSIQVRLGDGPMSWGDAVHYSVGPLPRAIDTILLPGDGIQDLLCANTHHLTVMVGLGEGNFRSARGYDTGLDRPGKILLADLNGNGNMDYVAISAQQRSITFHEGAGDGTFTLGAELPMDNAPVDVPTGLGVADVDGDGDLDVLATIASQDEVRLYRSNGSVGGFMDALPSDITSVGAQPTGMAIGDFNLDGMPDFVVTNRGDQTIQLFYNNGSGSFAPQVPVATQLFSPAGIRCADFDADGSMDLAVTGSTQDGFELRIFKGDAEAGSLTFMGSYTIDDVVNSMELGDFNSDGLLDLVVGQSTHSSSDIFILINLNDGVLGFQNRRTSMETIGPANVMVSDLDNDSNLDILVASSEGQIRIILGDGLGGFGDPMPGRGELPLIDACFSTSLVDVSGDGLPDIMSVSKFSPFLWVGLNTSVESSVTN